MSGRKMAMGVVQYGGILLMLLLVVVVVMLVSVFSQRGPSGLGLQHRNTRSVADCQVNGTTYTNGSTFTLVSGGTCQRYQCNGGQYHAISSAGCSFNGQCVDVNSTVQHQCSNYTCSQYNVSGLTQYNMSITTVGCQFNDDCLNVNETMEDRCSNFTCVEDITNGFTRYYINVTHIGCMDTSGTCHNQGVWFADGSFQCMCLGVDDVACPDK